jgi:UDP-GlcNAc3NAcA epimerase
MDVLNQSGFPVVIPLHPRTRNMLRVHNKSFGANNNLKITRGLAYLDMLVLEKNSRIVLTDSGGVQKEAFFWDVPCITLREETEWIETVDCGWNILAGADKLKIARAIEKFESKLIPGKKEYCYGHGNAAGKIVRVLSKSMKQLSSNDQRGVRF